MRARPAEAGGRERREAGQRADLGLPAPVGGNRLPKPLVKVLPVRQPRVVARDDEGQKAPGRARVEPKGLDRAGCRVVRPAALPVTGPQVIPERGRALADVVQEAGGAPERPEAGRAGPSLAPVGDTRCMLKQGFP